MYRQLLLRLKLLFVRPRKVWEMVLSEKASVNTVLMQISLPLIGAFTLATFLGQIINFQGLDYITAVRKSTFVFSSCFFGLYVVHYISCKLFDALQVKMDDVDVFAIIAYASAPIYLLGLIAALIPELSILLVGVAYVGYLIGLAVQMRAENDGQPKVLLVMITTLLTLGVPYGLFKMLFYLSNLLL